MPSRLFFILTVIASALSCTSTVRGETEERSAAATAVEPCRLGMSTALSGPASLLGAEVRRGVQAAVDRINRSGGVHGRPVQLIALDDAYDPSRTVVNVRKLIDEDDVQAIIGNVGTPTALAAIPICAERRVVYFAPFTGATQLRRTPVNPWVFNVRASYYDEIEAAIAELVDRGGIAPAEIAVFSQRDAYGDAGFSGVIAALQKRGLAKSHHLTHVRYERNTLAVEGAVANLLCAPTRPRAVMMIGTYGPSARFVRCAYESGLDALFVNVSFAGSHELAQRLEGVPARVVVTQVMPSPEDEDIAIVREFNADLKIGAPDAKPTHASLEGYVAMRLLGQALDKLAPEAPREELSAALEHLDNSGLTIDGGPLGFAPDRHEASRSVWATRLREGRVVPIEWGNLNELALEGGHR